jgi:ribose 5-phosphate isomerase B
MTPPAAITPRQGRIRTPTPKSPDMDHSPFNLFLPVAVGSDHAGFDYKEDIRGFLAAQGLAVRDFGAYSTESADYPDHAHAVAEAVEKGECAFGILFCGSGNGVAMAANKHAGIRAAICWNTPIAEVARAHNDANILCIPARYISLELSRQMVERFLVTEFEGGRHARRVGKIACS